MRMKILINEFAYLIIKFKNSTNKWCRNIKETAADLTKKSHIQGVCSWPIIVKEYYIEFENSVLDIIYQQ